jgi:hypothetical protein
MQNSGLKVNARDDILKIPAEHLIQIIPRRGKVTTCTRKVHCTGGTPSFLGLDQGFFFAQLYLLTRQRTAISILMRMQNDISSAINIYGWQEDKMIYTTKSLPISPTIIIITQSLQHHFPALLVLVLPPSQSS